MEEALTRSVIGCFFDVYNILKFGLLESLYSRALEWELLSRGHRVTRLTASPPARITHPAPSKPFGPVHGAVASQGVNPVIRGDPKPPLSVGPARAADDSSLRQPGRPSECTRRQPVH